MFTNSIFDCITQPQFNYCFTDLTLTGTSRFTCSSSLLAAYKLTGTEKLLTFKEVLLMFGYVLVVSRGCILLISICPMLKARNLHIIGSCSILAILFKTYFKGEKIFWLFPQLYQISTDCFVLTVNTVSRFKNRICIAARRKKIKFYLYLANEEMGTATVDPQ